MAKPRSARERWSRAPPCDLHHRCLSNRAEARLTVPGLRCSLQGRCYCARQRSRVFERAARKRHDRFLCSVRQYDQSGPLTPAGVLIPDYESLRRALNERRVALKMTMLSLDLEAQLQDGYAAKMFCGDRN